MRIRTTTDLDCDPIRKLHLRAFAEDEREIVSQLAVNLLSEETTPETISLVAETEGAIVGHIAFSPVTAADNKTLLGYLLGPLAVEPKHQKQGIGTQLVESGLQRVSGMDAEVLLVYGNPDYYNRFGFVPQVAENYTPPCPLKYPFGWLGIILDESRMRKFPTMISCVPALNNPELW